ncbi:MAG: acetate--CoA ligase family protein, partial [Spirochaetota bacterium]
PVFGPVVLAGMGGIFIEIFKDRSIRLAPVSMNEARDMLLELKAHPILEGARGGRPLDIDALVDVICRISALACAHPEISEIDLNPVIVYPKGMGVGIVDSRVFFRGRVQGPPPWEGDNRLSRDDTPSASPHGSRQ